MVMLYLALTCSTKAGRGQGGGQEAGMPPLQQVAGSWQEEDHTQKACGMGCLMVSWWDVHKVGGSN